MKKNHGFTLIEIIVTVALIGVIMSLTIPGLMNYFSDVDMDKARSEANSVLSVAQNYQNQLSLAGQYNGDGNVDITDQSVKDSIVEKAKGSGKLDVLSFEKGEVKRFKYVVSGYSIELSVTGDLVVLNADDDYFQN